LYKKKNLGICGRKKVKKHKIKIILFALSLRLKCNRPKVWFDTDLMIGMPDKTPREVDDGITLIMALKQPQIEIVELAQLPMWTTATMLSIRFKMAS
jgi:coproporphyrinogen III oxidase-like Fe-S oxidoreductase